MPAIRVGSSRARPGVDPRAVMTALEDVADPEIPAVSIVELGMIGGIDVEPDRLRVELLPTFVGCPALELIKASIVERLAALGRPVEVMATFEVPWTSDRISPAGRQALLEAGITPPGPVAEARAGGTLTLIGLEPRVPCPYCGSRRTVLDNAFGPTQCRTIRSCVDCRQPFEAIKPV